MRKCKICGKPYEKRKDFQRLCLEHRKEYARLLSKEWRAANPEKQRKNNSEWRAKNRLKINAAHREWIKNNREKASTWARNWRKKNQLKSQVYGFNHQYGCRISLHDIEEMMSKQRGRCPGCNVGIAGKFHIDHVVSRSSGGSHDLKNLQLLCEKCNRAKFVWTWKDFIDHAHRISQHHGRQS